jgi:hypothetical protein
VRRRAITGTPAAAAASETDLQAAAAFWWRDLSRRGSLGRRQPVLYLSTQADKPPAAVPDQPCATADFVNVVRYLTATTSTGRMSGSLASRSAGTLADAGGIWPLTCAVRASSIPKVSLVP